jgi:hypothetical protein
MGDTNFEELEEFHQFWDPDLLLPENVTREELYEEHTASMPVVRPHVYSKWHPWKCRVNINVRSPWSSQSSSASYHGSQSQSQSTNEGGSLGGSLNLNANGMLTFGYPSGAITFPHSQNWDDIFVPTLSLDTSMGTSADNCVDLTSPSTPPPSSSTPKEEEIDFDEWLHEDNESETEDNTTEVKEHPFQEQEKLAKDAWD